MEPGKTPVMMAELEPACPKCANRSLARCDIVEKENEDVILEKDVFLCGICNTMYKIEQFIPSKELLENGRLKQITRKPLHQM